MNSFLGLLGRVRIAHDPQPGMRPRDAFRTDRQFHLRQVKQHVLDDLVSCPLAADRCQVRSAPIQHPVIRREREDA